MNINPNKRRYLARRDVLSGTAEMEAEALVKVLNPELKQEALDTVLKLLKLKPSQVVSIKITAAYLSCLRRGESFTLLYLAEDPVGKERQGTISTVPRKDFSFSKHRDALANKNGAKT